MIFKSLLLLSFILVSIFLDSHSKITFKNLRKTLKQRLLTCLGKRERPLASSRFFKRGELKIEIGWCFFWDRSDKKTTVWETLELYKSK